MARKREATPEPESREFMFEGTLTLDGVIFFIEAGSLEEAKELARLGKYDDCDMDGASAVDCSISPSSGEENT